MAGAAYLGFAVNVLAFVLAVVTLLSYLFLCTPLKRKTPLCTLVGAFSGAVPPLIGWAAARGRLDLAAWALYAIVFLWQFPHFMAIAWMYREDYSGAGYLVLPFGQSRERSERAALEASAEVVKKGIAALSEITPMEYLPDIMTREIRVKSRC